VVRGWLGVMIQRITPELKEKLGLEDEKGALVADVTPKGPAETAGIKRGDVIVSFDGKEIKEMNDLPFVVASTPVGKVVTVEVIRKGKKKNVHVKIGRLEEEGEAVVEAKQGTELGITVEEITPEMAQQFGLADEKGLVVVQVEDNSPAAEAGIRQGDVILEIEQGPVRTLGDYRKKIQQLKKGDTVLFLLKREGSTLYLTLKVWE
jgi:serine protease Do